MEEKVYKANKTSLELLKQLKDAEAELGQTPNYTPVREDPIDMRLADFIATYPGRLNFVRESEGIYQFGQKRIAVKLDKDKLSVRVGGGYLPMEEFLEQ